MRSGLSYPPVASGLLPIQSAYDPAVVVNNGLWYKRELCKDHTPTKSALAATTKQASATLLRANSIATSTNIIGIAVGRTSAASPQKILTKISIERFLSSISKVEK